VICEKDPWNYCHWFGLVFKVLLIANVIIVFSPLTISARNNNNSDTVQNLTLKQCISYALLHQPSVIRSAIDITIARKTNGINLSEWLPQVYINGNFTHYYQLPVIFTVDPANPTGPLIKGHSGFINSFFPSLSATQTIFNPDVLYAARSAPFNIKQAKQANDSTKIDIIASVSKAFYGLLITLEQMNVLEDDTVRLSKTLRDTYHQYIGGIVDKTDYKEAFISLNNSKAQLKQAMESVRPQYATLKQLMGFPPGKEFSVSFDTLQMMREIAFDTTQKLEYEKRIEYQQIETAKSLQHLAIQYYRTQFLPSLSAVFNYNYGYESDLFSNFFNQAYPNSYIGATISIPLFTGLRHIRSVQRAKLQGQQLEWAEVDLKSRISSQYLAAMANYRSNLYDLNVLRDNVAMAKDVYSVVELQYSQGIVEYLNVITAESNLISSEINYLNALFQLLLSKVDLEKSMGNTLSKQ
jgi:outer membrane protein TolC